jgi:hypothetical protein
MHHFECDDLFPASAVKQRLVSANEGAQLTSSLLVSLKLNEPNRIKSLFKADYGFDFGNADWSAGSFFRNSSKTARESSELLITTGVIRITNSVRCLFID